MFSFRYIIFICVNLVLLVILNLEAGINRYNEPVILTGSQLPEFRTVSTNQIHAYIYRSTPDLWIEIPLQIDEKNASGNYLNFINTPLKNYLGLDDEIVLMSHDLGEKVDSTEWIDDAVSKTHSRYEIEMQNPLSPDETAYVYLYQSHTLPDTLTTDYVDEDAHVIYTPIYTLGHDTSRGYINHLNFPEKKGYWGLDLLDRQKFRFNGTVRLMGIPINFETTEERFLANDKEYIDGRIRVLRKMNLIFKLNVAGFSFDKPVATLISKFYFANCDIATTQTEIPDEYSISLFRHSLDLDKNAGSFQFFNAHNSEILIDGQPDESIQKQLDLPGMFWSLVTGSNGTILQTSWLADLPGNSHQLYYHDAAHGTDDGTPDTGSNTSWGDNGLLFRDNLKGYFHLAPMFHFSSEQVSSDWAEEKIIQLENPLQVMVNKNDFVEPQPSITLISPNGGEELTAGSEFRIYWTSSNLDGSLAVKFSEDGGQTFYRIGSFPSSVNEMEWIVPETHSDQCLIMLQCVEDSLVSDRSDNYFKIIPKNSILSVSNEINITDFPIIRCAAIVAQNGSPLTNLTKNNFTIKEDSVTEILLSCQLDQSQNNKYLLNYTTHNSRHDSTWRNVEVFVNYQNCEGRTSSGYFAPSDSEFDSLLVLNASGIPDSRDNQVTIQLTNHVPVRGIQFDLLANSNWLSFSKSQTITRTTGFTLSATDKDSLVQCLLYHTGGGSIESGNGAIIELFYNLDAQAQPGTQINLKLENVLVADMIAENLPVTTQDGVFSVLGISEIFFDDFNRSEIGSNWNCSPADGAISIINYPPDGQFRLYNPNASGTNTQAFIAVPATQIKNVALSFDYDNGPEDRQNNNTEIYIRYQNEENYYSVTVWEDSYSMNRQNVRINEVVNGVRTILDEKLETILAPGRYEFSAIENQIVFVNLGGGTPIYLTATDNDLLVDGSIGISVNEETILLDNLQVSSTPSITNVNEDGRPFSDETLVEVDNFELLPGYPNPFNSQTKISYRIPEACYVNLSICNILGQEIRCLLNENKQPGEFSATWNGRDSNGKDSGSGIYLVRIQAGDFIKTQKIVLVR